MAVRVARAHGDDDAPSAPHRVRGEGDALDDRVRVASP